jgi:hypothetical protein
LQIDHTVNSSFFLRKKFDKPEKLRDARIVPFSQSSPFTSPFHAQPFLRNIFEGNEQHFKS